MCSNLVVHLLSAVWGFNHRSVGVLAGEIDASGGDYGLVNGPSGQLSVQGLLCWPACLPTHPHLRKIWSQSHGACTDTDVIACDVQCASNARNGNLSRSTVSFAPILRVQGSVLRKLGANTSGFLRGPAVFTSADLLRCVSKLGLLVRINGL